MGTGDIGEVVGFGELMGKGQGRARGWKGDGASGGVLNSEGEDGAVVVEGGLEKGRKEWMGDRVTLTY